MTRVAVFFDGFNFYYGLKALKAETGVCFYWLDLHALAVMIMQVRPGANPTDQLMGVAYFTADIKDSDPLKRSRQQKYFGLINEEQKVRLIKGSYQIRSQKCPVCEVEPATCKSCNQIMRKHQEKKTDVNIALNAMSDAKDDLYDDLVIVTSDSDLAPIAPAVRRHYPDKRVYICFPPKQLQLHDLKDSANGYCEVSYLMLEHCMLPRKVEINNKNYRCPEEWMQGGAVK